MADEGTTYVNYAGVANLQDQGRALIGRLYQSVQDVSDNTNQVENLLSGDQANAILGVQQKLYSDMAEAHSQIGRLHTAIDNYTDGINGADKAAAARVAGH